MSDIKMSERREMNEVQITEIPALVSLWKCKWRAFLLLKYSKKWKKVVEWKKKFCSTQLAQPTTQNMVNSWFNFTSHSSQLQ